MGKKAFKAKMVKGKQQRAATYQPGYDVICVRAPNKVIDRIRAMAKKADKSISALVSAKFGFPTGTAKKATRSTGSRSATRKVSAAKTSRPSPTKMQAGDAAAVALQ